jgi:lipoyl(octanoyl) transferase
MRLENWGLVDYRQALAQQEKLVGDVARGEVADTLVFCSHPPVVTVGRLTPASDFAGWRGDVVEVSRGGRATYHGPGQIVVYPIVSLAREGRMSLPPRDLHAFLRGLGDSVVKALHHFDILAEYRQGEDDSFQQADGEHRRHVTGVWVGERKIASIGVAARQWVTFHGVALNLESDASGLGNIQPCGFAPSIMTSMREILGKPPDRSEVERVLADGLGGWLG